MKEYINNDLFAPKYLFRGSPKFLKTIEQREEKDSSGNFENEDFAVFLTSSFLVATAYAFKDQIKKLSDGKKYDNFIGKNHLERYL